ncbi:MAG TPA: hypothetical protein VLB06_11965, partial [Sulfuricaulis sp.]|nr:hypothetical protein [Sulfuricaulis sp.]
MSLSGQAASPTARGRPGGRRAHREHGKAQANVSNDVDKLPYFAVPVTSTSTRRFLARPAAVLLS